MSPLDLFLAAVAFFVVVVAPIFAAIAFARTRRIRELALRVERLERELARRPLGAESTVPTAERTVAPAAMPPPPLPPPSPRPIERPVTERAAIVEAPSTATTPRTGPAAPRPPQRARIEWERWIGVRGAALLSGLAIAVAGILLYRHAIEHGWVTPAMRVIAGATAGIVAIAGGEFLRRRAFRFAPAALAGAGIVLLYASTWASYRLYGMLPFGAAFPAMAAITALCSWLSVRHDAQAVAALGILGGFATPLVITRGEPNALGLFGYVLVLDLGLVALARRRAWPALAVLGVLCTFAIEGIWIRTQLEAGSMNVTLVALGLLGLVFVAFGEPRGAGDRRAWWASQAAAALLPFALALELAGRAELGSHLVPLALLLLVLEIGAAVAGARQQLAWLAGAAAAASLAVVAAWTGRDALDAPLAWELALAAFALGLPFPALELWRARRGGEAEPGLRVAGAVAAGGFLALFASLPTRQELPLVAPLLAGLASSSGLLFASGRGQRFALARWSAGFGLGLGLALLLVEHPDALPAGGAAAALLVAALSMQAVASIDRDRNARCAAALVSLAPLLVLGVGGALREATAWIALGTFAALGASMALAAARLSSGRWLLVATLATAFAEVIWSHGELVRIAGGDARAQGGVALALAIASTILFVVWPSLFRARFREQPDAWRAAAIAGLLGFAATRPLSERVLGERWAGAVALVHAIALAAALVAANAHDASDERARATRRVAFVWLSAGVAFFAALAVSIEVGRYEQRVAFALFGAALLWIWRRLDHEGLLACAALALLASSASVFGAFTSRGFYPRSPVPVWNWTSYAHLVPAACLVAGAIFLRPHEVERARSFRWTKRSGKPVISSTCGLLAAGVCFLWINLEVFDALGTGERIVVDLGHDERRDLALSIAWIVYALALLALGMARKLSGLRWLSLGFLVLALGKVFLYDLDRLEGLYRVASLLGLGLSLLLVSLLYQRFVFPRDREPRMRTVE